MTPKQKAIYLVDRLDKKFALICVHEVNNQINILYDSIDHAPLSIYWEKVKQEIEKL